MGSKNKKTTSTTRVETKKKKTKNNFAEKAPVKSKNKSKEFNNRKINSSKSLKKDYNEKKPETPLENSNEMSKLIKIVLVVTAIMVVFYGITILATKKADKVKNETRKDTVDTSDVAEIQYDRIIIGTMFNYPGSYYVLIKEKGEDYKCGENGCNLSGGEKQRIAIARGLLKNSQIILLDEITSALDNETSNTITNNVLQLKDITKIMITHRLEETVLRNFDEILVIKNGKIYEQGTYDELIENNSLFKTLVELN